MNPDATFTYGTLNSKNIVSDPAYQRPVNPSRVRAIAEHFDPLKVNPLKVSHRDGKYFVFDGQHTMKVLILRNKGNDVMLSCIIYEGLTQTDEANLFARQGEYVKAPNKNEEMKALYAAGDPEIIELKKIIESAGFVFDFSKQHANGRIVCCNQALKLFRKSKNGDFTKTLEILKSSWQGSSESLRREIFGGVWIFYTTFKDNIDLIQCCSKFMKINPVEILREGKEFRSLPGDTKYAYVLAKKYNVNQRKNKIDPNKLLP